MPSAISQPQIQANPSSLPEEICLGGLICLGTFFSLKTLKQQLAERLEQGFFIKKNAFFDRKIEIFKTSCMTASFLFWGLDFVFDKAGLMPYTKYSTAAMHLTALPAYAIACVKIHSNRKLLISPKINQKIKFQSLKKNHALICLNQDFFSSSLFFCFSLIKLVELIDKCTIGLFSNFFFLFGGIEFISSLACKKFFKTTPEDISSPIEERVSFYYGKC